MKTKKIAKGVYIVEDSTSTFIIKNVQPIIFDNEKHYPTWQAWETNNPDECSDLNNWGVGFKSKKLLLEYSQSFKKP